MQSDSLFRTAKASADECSEALDRMSKENETDLYAELAARVEQVIGSAGPVDSDDLLRSDSSRVYAGFGLPLNKDSFERGDIDLGKRIFWRWSQALHGFVCRADVEDKDLQDRLLTAISGKSGGSTALVAAVLAGYFSLPPAVAAVTAALLVKLIATPMAEEVCQTWAEALTAHKKQPVADSPEGKS